ncbi:HNH endonuclease [Exiguobacterium undae]|uniref:HNH endonuclease n=1 Tax=Exiguobacterium undae TaxID=169177 RepID=UPI00384F3B1E
MNRLSKPEYSLEDFFEEMLLGRHNNEKNSFLITRLLSVQPLLVIKEKAYENLAGKKELHTTEAHDTIFIPFHVKLDSLIPRTVIIAEMEKVYKSFFVDKPDSIKIGRKVYDSILQNTEYNLCPYCSHREVKTVDHYLPKSKFISFAVTPLNLLPCCSDCNKAKLDDYNPFEEKMLIHPYFDDLSSVDWLDCNVKECTWPITFSFEVSEDIADSVIKSRLKYQFKLLGLDKLYADNATREFRKRVKSLVKEYDSDKSNEALDFLDDNYESYYYDNANSWQTKMFKALKSSIWFRKEALPKLKKFYMTNCNME